MFETLNAFLITAGIIGAAVADCHGGDFSHGGQPGMAGEKSFWIHQTDERFAMLRVFNGTESQTDRSGAHRTHSPVLHRETQIARSLIEAERVGGIDADVMAAVAAMTSTADQPQVIPADQRQQYAARTSLRQFYTDWMVAPRTADCQAGYLSEATLKKDRAALNRWEKHTRPADWPHDRGWPGPPLGSVTKELLEKTWQRARSDLSPGTIKVWWYSLRTILNEAVKRRAIEICPTPRLPTDSGTGAGDHAIWSLEDIDLSYSALRVFPDLQVAFVLGCTNGLRASDLFCLRWSDLDETGDVPMLSFRAQKTGKLQRLPVHPVTMKQLDRLPRVDAFMFPGRSSPDSRDPERSRAARNRNETVKQLIVNAGFKPPQCPKCQAADRPASRWCRKCWEIFKPWQRCRRTCNEHLERTKPGVGEFVLGHSLSLNSRSYRDPSEDILRVMTGTAAPPHDYSPPATFQLS